MARRAISSHWKSLALGLLSSDLVFLAGCQTQPELRPGPVQLDFLQVGQVTRASVNAHLGPPSASFDKDGVVTYRLVQAPQGYFVVPQSVDTKRPKGSDDANFQTPIDWQGITYDLVLGFDASGMVSQYRLIPIHQQSPPH